MDVQRNSSKSCLYFSSTCMQQSDPAHCTKKKSSHDTNMETTHNLNQHALLFNLLHKHEASGSFSTSNTGKRMKPGAQVNSLSKMTSVKWS